MRNDSHTLPLFQMLASASVFSLVLAQPCWAASCEDMVNLKLPNTVIKSAQQVGAGEFIVPGRGKLSDLPAFCRVIALVQSAPDSDINVEIWLPSDQWKGGFHGNGNGGYAGTLAAGYAGMEAGLRRGYASATTDMGTAPASGLNGDPLIGHPQKWKDWGMLSTHVMTATGKAIVKAFYGEDAKHSYFSGCSTGGQQALIEALYYPEDYDGILAGAPVINRTWGHAVAIWDYSSANLQPGHKLSDAKLALLHKAALSACGEKSNGLASDPFISDPLTCKFDPAELTCKGEASDSCLTAAEVQTAKDFYSGPTNHAGHATYYGWEPGSEVPGRAGWGFTQSAPNSEPAFDGLFKWVFGRDWNWRTFDFDRDMPKVDAELGPALNGVIRGNMTVFGARRKAGHVPGLGGHLGRAGADAQLLRGVGEEVRRDSERTGVREAVYGARRDALWWWRRAQRLQFHWWRRK